MFIISVFSFGAQSPVNEDEARGTPLGSRADIDAAYFQQGIYYKIDAFLDTESDIITGTEHLIYRNNSADTLREVYFHLYQNAFSRGSLHDDRQESEGDFSLRNLKPGGTPGTTIEVLKDEQGLNLTSSLNETRLKVHLDRPLLPGRRAEFSIRFKTRIGEVNRRMHKGSDYYVGSQWYPRMAVYDAKRGWNIDPHLGNEFYGDFGTFDWTLTLPENYIVEGTGQLTNREAMLPPDLMEKLDIRKYKDKPFGSPASVVIPKSDSTKTWIFHAENVHDIAWIASPDFRIGVSKWGDITVYAMAREQHAARWQDAAEIGAQFIADYSKRWGDYQYPKMIVSDVDDGMEYPMLTADSGASPGYIGLLGHEIGHNWFFGMIGSNETYRAFLDEGFTNFITCTTMDSIWGPGSATPYKGWYARTFYPRKSRKYIRNDWRYLRFARSGFEKLPLNTHSDQYLERANYRLVYSKTTSMLFALQGVLGESIFTRGMRSYFRRFLFQHPYPEDFQKVMEQTSGRRLGWFFEQWLNTTRQIDYSVTGLKTVRSADQIFARVSLHRSGEMSMPLDVDLELKDGSHQWVHIPNRFDQKKPVPDGWQVTEPWLGWQRIRPEFSFDVAVSSPAKRAVIDPSGRLMDVNRLNNRNGLPRIHVQFDNMKVYYPTLDAYDIYLRPSFLYNKRDGLKPGLHWTSGYLLSPEIRQYHFRMELHYAASRAIPDYALFYETPVKTRGSQIHAFLKLEDREGRRLREVGMTGIFRERLFLKPVQEINIFYRESSLTDTTYIPDFQRWDAGSIKTLNFHYSISWKNGLVSTTQRFDFESAVPGSDFLYTQQRIETTGSLNALPALKIRGIIARQRGEIPEQFAVRLEGARFFEVSQRNWLYRSIGSLGTSDWLNNRIQPAGGGNFRSINSFGKSLHWLAGISGEYELSPSIFLWRPFVTGLSALNVRVYLFGSVLSFDVARDGRSRQTVSEAGAGVFIPLNKIPDALGKYGIRIDHAYPVQGEGLAERTVFALERAW